MKFKTLISLAFATSLAGAAQASISIDGTVSAAEYAGALTTYIPFDANATGDFSMVGSSSATVGYTVYYTSDANNVYVGLKADAGAAALNFANLYFDTNNATSPGSDIGFEVLNNDVFKPGNTTIFSPLTLRQLGGDFASTAGTATTGAMIEVSIPWKVFTTTASGLNFPLLAPGGALQLRSSQSFGYIVDGGSQATYTTTRFGSIDAPAAAVPEPTSWAMMVGGFGLLGGALRRRTRTVIA